MSFIPLLHRAHEPVGKPKDLKGRARLAYAGFLLFLARRVRSVCDFIADSLHRPIDLLEGRLTDRRRKILEELWYEELSPEDRLIVDEDRRMMEEACGRIVSQLAQVLARKSPYFDQLGFNPADPHGIIKPKS